MTLAARGAAKVSPSISIPDSQKRILLPAHASGTQKLHHWMGLKLEIAQRTGTEFANEPQRLIEKHFLGLVKIPGLSGQDKLQDGVVFQLGDVIALLVHAWQPLSASGLS